MVTQKRMIQEERKSSEINFIPIGNNFVHIKYTLDATRWLADFCKDFHFVISNSVEKWAPVLKSSFLLQQQSKRLKKIQTTQVRLGAQDQTIMSSLTGNMNCAYVWSIVKRTGKLQTRPLIQLLSDTFGWLANALCWIPKTQIQGRMYSWRYNLPRLILICFSRWFLRISLLHCRKPLYRYYCKREKENAFEVLFELCGVWK